MQEDDHIRRRRIGEFERMALANHNFKEDAQDIITSRMVPVESIAIDEIPTVDLEPDIADLTLEENSLDKYADAVPVDSDEEAISTPDQNEVIIVDDDEEEIIIIEDEINDGNITMPTATQQFEEEDNGIIVVDD